MNFLANENIPYDSIAVLRNHQHTVISIKEQTPGISDIAVLNLAKESNAIILTFDKDYGDIIFRLNYENPPSEVFFRFKGFDSFFAANTLLKIIANPTIQLQGFFTIVEQESIRQRKFYN